MKQHRVRPLTMAKEGDFINGTDLKIAIDVLNEMAVSVYAAAKNKSTAERRVIQELHNRLLETASRLAVGRIELVAGRPKINARQINDAVVYAGNKIAATTSINTKISQIINLLVFCGSVYLGDGDRMLRAAQTLKTQLDHRSGTAPVATGVNNVTVRANRLNVEGTRGPSALESRRYVLLPVRNVLRSPELDNLTQVSNNFLSALSVRAPLLRESTGTAADPLHILHSSHEDGPKLATMTSDEAQALKVSSPGVKAVPLVYYELCRRPVLEVIQRATVATSGLRLAVKIQITDQHTGRAIAGARVLAFTNFISQTGVEGTSNGSGYVSLQLGASIKKIDRLVIYGPPGYWGLCRQATTLKTGDTISLSPIDLSVPDYVTTVYGLGSQAGQGVTVGVIDTGVDLTHPDLTVSGGAVFVIDERDNGDEGPAAVDGEHGSHVAGIIASRGTSPSGKSGIAPKVTLMSYRVFPHAGGGATNYDIIRAIQRGVEDKCDLLNLSLSSDVADDGVRHAIQAARERGTVCVVATGNDDRQPVSYPAKWPEAVAVSAVGKTGTFPADSTESLDVVAPFSPLDPTVFIARFSNVGPEVDLTGPGVGIVSTVPPGKYGVMSGTSMACPAQTGALAALLSQRPDILAMPRNAQRALEIIALMTSSAKTLQFPPNFEGGGMLS